MQTDSNVCVVCIDWHQSSSILCRPTSSSFYRLFVVCAEWPRRSSVLPRSQDTSDQFLCTYVHAVQATLYAVQATLHAHSGSPLVCTKVQLTVILSSKGIKITWINTSRSYKQPNVHTESKEQKKCLKHCPVSLDSKTFGTIHSSPPCIALAKWPLISLWPTVWGPCMEHYSTNRPHYCSQFGWLDTPV